MGSWRWHGWDMDKVMGKRELRARMRALGDVAEVDSQAVCRVIAGRLHGLPSGCVVAGYAPLPGEVDIWPLIDDFTGLAWVFPKVTGEGMAFARVRDAQREMRAGAYGVMEPLGDLEEVAAGEIDVFLCPGLAFDDRGGRLGRGKGYYDRALSAARDGAEKWGVCGPGRLVDEVFAEAHDVAMDWVAHAGVTGETS